MSTNGNHTAIYASIVQKWASIDDILGRIGNCVSVTDQHRSFFCKNAQRVLSWIGLIDMGLQLFRIVKRPKFTPNVYHPSIEVRH